MKIMRWLASLLLFSFGLLLTGDSIAADPLQITLTQAVDRDCDGVAEAATAVASTAEIAPGECLAYRIELENHSDRMLERLDLTALIPPHTRLQQAPSWQRQAPVQVMTQDEGSVHIRLDTLAPGAANRRVLRYGVRVW
ncbi:MAG TPA: hypothetical protein PLB10_06425 [Thiolinea sp.]|nr:hypothetical protein [Thiolinea sp.]